MFFIVFIGINLFAYLDDKNELNKYTVINPEGTLMLKTQASLPCNTLDERKLANKRASRLKKNEVLSEKVISSEISNRPSISLLLLQEHKINQVKKELNSIV